MDENQVLEIFRQLDHNATGFVGRDEFRSVFGQYIGTKLADDIFLVLDQDGDGVMKIKDLINELRIYMRENAFSLDEPSIGDLIERRRSDIMLAWSHVVEAIGEPAVRKFLNNSGKKLEELYHELQSRCTAPDLIDHVEGALTSLFQDVKQVLDDNEKLKHMFHKEKETHLERLRGLEEELDAQVAKVEAEAREQAHLKFEQEKKELMEKMETEMAEMQTRLKLFEKVNTILTQKIEEKNNMRRESSTQKAELRSTLTHTNTNLALVEAEMARMKADYEFKCKELDSHQEVFMQFIDQNEHIQRQLSLLHKANKSLQDTNDSLLSAIETTGGRITPFCCSRNGSDTNSNPSEKSQSCVHSVRKWYKAQGCVGGEIEQHPHSFWDKLSLSDVSKSYTHDTTIRQDILHEHMQHCGAQYTIQRLMEDIDSGHATLRDQLDYDSDPKSLQEELYSLSDAESALKSVESNDRRCTCSSTGRHYQSKSNSCLTNGSCHEPTGEPDRTYKVVFAGDAAVGKSCLIHRFCKGSFVKRLGSTLGVDFQIKTIRIDEKNVALQLWDTAGQERFRSMTKTYFRRADGVVLLYDVTSERSFISIRQWIQSINEAADKNIPTLVCANKVDLRDEVQNLGARCVSREAGENLAKDYQALFFETSSKTGENILDALIALSREMLLREDVEVQTSALTITRNEKKSFCCSSSS